MPARAARLSDLAQVAQPPRQSPFRAGVDLVQVDVSVLDKQRHPVRGLTAADFTLLEDGKPRAIVAFSAVELPARANAPLAPWTTSVAPDVATNTLPEEGRLVVILLDRSISDGYPMLKAREIARAAVQELGPGDLAAVVYTGGGTPHDFTSDRAALVAAIDGASPAAELSDSANEVWNDLLSGLENPVSNPGLAALNFSSGCLCGACVLDSIARIAEAVRDVSRRRKSLLFIGRDLQVETTESICIDPVHKARNAMFRALDLASLTVHSLDPGGLETLSDAAGTRVRAFAGYPGRARGNLVRQGNISVLPDHTGGRTVLNTNNPTARVPEIFAESDSYYLLGFEPGAKDGRRHAVSVKVSRRGLDVRTRRGYVADGPAEAPTGAAAAPASVAVGGVMPAHDGVSLSAHVAPFADPETTLPILAVALHVQHDPVTEAPPPAPASGTETVELLTEVFTMTGRPVGLVRHTLAVRPRADQGGEVSYDVLERIPAKPGHYEVRIGLHNESRHQTGSVYTYVDVPDYRKTRFTLGQIEMYLPNVSPAMAGGLSDVLLAPASARRTFEHGERATAFVRLYQASSALPVRVFLSSSIVDERNRKRYGQAASIEASAFAPDGSTDYVVDLPLADLEAGDYLLSIDAKAGTSSLQRQARFTVK